MSEIKQAKASELKDDERQRHEGYSYTKKTFVPIGGAKQCAVAIYEIAPGMSAYPYHYHTMNEEVFYIISGTGVLKTPEGERSVGAGELLYFPACEGGAHKLTNASATEKLVYVDFDAYNHVDVAVYPDSGKIGIWGMGINKVFRADDSVDYFDGE